MKPSYAVRAEAAVLREAEKLMMFMEFTPDLYLHYGKELKWSKLCNMKQTGLSTLSSIAEPAVLLFF